MADNKFINNEKYHTCGRCKYDYTPDNEYPCKDCIYGTDFRKDLWKYNEESDDYISKEAVHDFISGLPKWCVQSEDGKFINVGLLYDDVMFGIAKLPPSVTPKKKTGHWIQQPRYEGDEQPDLVCPNCRFKISWWDMGNFCAKCGTGLEGGAG